MWEGRRDEAFEDLLVLLLGCHRNILRGLESMGLLIVCVALLRREGVRIIEHICLSISLLLVGDRICLLLDRLPWLLR